MTKVIFRHAKFHVFETCKYYCDGERVWAIMPHACGATDDPRVLAGRLSEIAEIVPR